MRPRKPADVSAQGARERALRALGRREHSAAQLKQKLEWRGFAEDTADQVIGDLSERGWQSDARYAEVLIRSRVSQGYGLLYIEAELEQAKVPQAQITAAFAEAAIDWDEAVQTLQRRRFGHAPQSLDERHKQYRYLAGRGFTSEQIRTALKAAVEAGAG